jgi:hypothetical protein
MLDISSNSFDTKVTETDSTPKRTVGYDVSWDKIGPKLCAMGTITGENSGMAELASCKKKNIKTTCSCPEANFSGTGNLKRRTKNLNKTFSE